MIGFALVAFVLVLFALRYLLNADPSFLADVLKNSLLAVVAIVLLFLLITGRASPYILPIMLLVVIPYILRKYRTSETPPSSASQDSVKESYDILGLKPGASRDEIIEAHRRLIKKNHPDKGGSAYLAQKLNEAKDILLKAQGHK